MELKKIGLFQGKSDGIYSMFNMNMVRLCHFELDRLFKPFANKTFGNRKL